jgi:hypothetical protein
MRPAAWIPTCLAALLAAGCSTKRYLEIASEPTGATVFVNGVPRGTTPVRVPFTYYGQMEVRLEKAGYQPLAGDVTVPTQLDGLPVIDLPQELLVRERRFAWTGRLKPIVTNPDEAYARSVLDTAKAFRARTIEETREPGTPGEIPKGFPWDTPFPGGSPRTTPPPPPRR